MYATVSSLDTLGPALRAEEAELRGLLPDRLCMSDSAICGAYRHSFA